MPGHRFEIGHHLAAKGLVAAVEAQRIPSDLAKHVHERARASAAAPAIHERSPVARPVAIAFLDHARDVACRERRPDALRLERGLLLVHRADQGAFRVVEDR